MRLHRLYLGSCLLAFAASTYGVGGSQYAGSQPSPDHEAAAQALERQEWETATAALLKIVAQRAWDDDAHTLLGFAYRKQGDYERSLQHYQRALELNPYHLGAMEYLGEAYLEQGDRAGAAAMLKRLAEACDRLRNPISRSGRRECPQWHELRALME